MTLEQWIYDQQLTQAKTKTAILKDLATQSGGSLVTLQFVCRGSRLVSYPKARAVSLATGGRVTVRELCEKEALR